MSKGKMTKIRYRFPKFHLDWKEDEFKGIFDFHQTNTFSRSQMNNRRGFTRNIHYGDILTKYGNILSDLQEVPYINKDISLLKFKEESYLQNGDIIIADTAEDLTVGKAMEVQNIDGKILSGLHTILCRPKFKFAPRFWGYYLNSSSYRRNLIPLVVGVKVCSISKTNISKTLVMYPDDINEQEKIADCLSSIDDLIFAEEKKLSLLNDYKKGWMQKLFPAEGKTVPEWRFPEFINGGDWEEKKLSGSLDYLQPGPYLVQSERYDDKYKTPVLTAGKSFVLGYTNEREGIFSKKLPVIIFDDFTTASKFVDFPFKVKSSAMKILIAKNNTNIKFIFEVVQMINYDVSVHRRHWIAIFSEIKVPIPKPKEQEKIANFLSGIDDLISTQTDRIEALKQHKKALMQGLFPSVEEVCK